MRMPLIFLGPNGPWDLLIFESAANAISYAEPPDVLAGEYGDHGWDADGKPVVLVTKLSEKQPGFVGKLLGLEPTLEVEVRELGTPNEPEALRNALLGRLAGLEPDFAAVAVDMDLDDLIDQVRRAIHERLEQVKKGPISKIAFEVSPTMDIMTPQYPILVRFSDGDRWSLDNEAELCTSPEWFDSEDPEEEAEVTDALGRRVRVEVVAHRLLRLELMHRR